MSDVDRRYREKYILPNCAVCGLDFLEYDTYKIHEVKLFCGNPWCPAFVQTFWVDKENLERND